MTTQREYLDLLQRVKTLEKDVINAINAQPAPERESTADQVNIVRFVNDNGTKAMTFVYTVHAHPTTAGSSLVKMGYSDSGSAPQFSKKEGVIYAMDRLKNHPSSAVFFGTPDEITKRVFVDSLQATFKCIANYENLSREFRAIMRR